jgi:hypothetical protein
VPERGAVPHGQQHDRVQADHRPRHANHRNRNRHLLRAVLRAWIAEKKLGASALVFTVPAELRRILDRDMKAAGIPKRDERNRTVDVHAMRTTFATMLSASGIAPRTAQAAMRHSDIKLTMGTYTDPKMLDVRQAVERLPGLSPAPTVPVCVHDCAHNSDPEGQNPIPADKMSAIRAFGKFACRAETLEMSTKNPR